MELAAIRHNVHVLRSSLPQSSAVIAVVKGGGYGHGAVRAGRAALEAGAWGLAVSTPAEAGPLRGLVAPERILLLGGLAPSDAAEAAAAGCAVMCHTAQVAAALAAAAPAGARLPVHLKVDTGMGRLGCSPDDAAPLAERIAGSSRLRLAGTMTHFAASESDPSLTRRQFELFMEVLARFQVEPGLRHAANSAAALRYPEMALDAVRAGIAVYGCGDPRLRPALTLCARVSQVKEVEAGTGIGYGHDWTARRRSRIATISIGYGDGVMRSRGGRGEVLVRGARAPLVGRVSMDAITADVTDITGVSPDDVATLIGSDGAEAISAEEVAAWSGTISYEVFTAIGTRVERRYPE